MPTIAPGIPAAAMVWLTAASSRCTTASGIGRAVVDDRGEVESLAQPDTTSSAAITARAITRALIARQVMRKRPAAARLPLGRLVFWQVVPHDAHPAARQAGGIAVVLPVQLP